MDIQRLMAVAEGARHKQYAHHVLLAKQYETLTTGEGLDELLSRYAMRESAALFEQRKRITQHVVMSVVDNIMQPFEKVPRSKYQRTLVYSTDTNNLPKLEKVVANFFDNNSLEHYLSERLIALNAIDPNAFLVVEIPANFAARSGDLVQPYPFEAYSNSCVDYQYDNDKLLYLIVKTEIELLDQNGKSCKGEKYTMYLPERVIVLQETLTETFLSQKVGNKLFELIEPIPHNLGEVPARRVGYKRARTKDLHTYIAPYHAAIPYLYKTIKVNSEFDMTMSNSAFPFSLRYTTPCPEMGCNNGVKHDGKACGSCHGTGVKQRPTSSMEEIEIALPNRAEDIIDLDKLIVFKAPPIDILQFQQDYIEKITEKAKQIVFNADIFSREQIAQTATSKNIQTENLYDVLFPFARKFAQMWQFCIVQIARYTDLEKGLVASLYFSKDLKMKTTSELIESLEAANRANAGNEVRRTIQQDIMRNIYAEDNYQYLRFVTKEMYNPFSGMTDAEIVTALNTEYTSLQNKVLYTNLGNVFDDLERESIEKGIDFYKVEKIKQRDLVMEKVNQLIAVIKDSVPQTTNIKLM